MMDTYNPRPALRSWLRSVAALPMSNPIFLRRVAESALIACIPDYLLLRPALLELKRRYYGGETG
jgi:hypothetical protein